MLIYNYKKEFLGIDEADLTTFELKTLADLRAESADFADLFVKTPGHIHNFKHVHWIDYVLDKDGAEAKVVIHIKNKNYSANISIETFYLVDNPSSKAFGIVLSNVRTLTGSQNEKLSSDINNQAEPETATGSTELFTTPGSIIHDQSNSSADSDVEFDPYESESAPTSTTVDDIYEQEIVVEDLTADDAPIDLDLEELTQSEPEPEPEEVKEVAPVVVAQEDSGFEEDSKFAHYVFDPLVASEELGLPIDLIEEFIQDFIAQAQSFKDELYQSNENQEMDNLKIQSHKLKGVAANLRIEDALDALSIINTADDNDVIKTNLDRFYHMIDKLSGKVASPVAPTLAVDEEIEIAIEDNDDDDMILSFKDDDNVASAPILDADVPASISIPELADDDFLATDVDEVSNEDLSVLDDVSDDEDNVYDKAKIANEIGLDIDSFNELFDDYIKESNELSQTIMQSADNNDLSICKSLATKLKGMSENMRIDELDSELESIISTTDTTKIKESVQEILVKLNQISNVEG